MLEASLKKDIQKDIKIATAHLKGSIYDEDGMDNNQKVIVNQISKQVQSQIDRKVDKVDFRDFLAEKTNKKEHEMALNMVNMLH